MAGARPHLVPGRAGQRVDPAPTAGGARRSAAYSDKRTGSSGPRPGIVCGFAPGLGSAQSDWTPRGARERVRNCLKGAVNIAPNVHLDSQDPPRLQIGVTMAPICNLAWGMGLSSTFGGHHGGERPSRLARAGRDRRGPRAIVSVAARARRRRRPAPSRSQRATSALLPVARTAAIVPPAADPATAPTTRPVVGRARDNRHACHLLCAAEALATTSQSIVSDG
jgi:hypothetical protein